ncbi:MAG: DUF6918 family protein [Trebonia sp.]
MPATLAQMLLGPNTLPQVVSDCQALVDHEISSKSGVSATAVKMAYKAVTAFAPGYYQNALTAMLPGFVEQLEPYWSDFLYSGGANFGDYLAKRGDEVSESLLVVTDQLAGSSQKAAIVRAYKTVRGGASKNIEAALPNLGDLVQRYAY